MAVRQRALVTATPEAWRRLQPLVAPLVDAVHVQTSSDAFTTLAREPIELIICTIAFEDSRMIEFLQAVKLTRAASIPFICCRALPGVLSDKMVEHMREACVQCGAHALVDIAKLDDDQARNVLRSVVADSLPRQ